MKLRNNTDFTFSDISTEQWREYTFPNNEVLRITAPLYLAVSDSQGHRILDAAGESHYISAKWLTIRWKAKEGEPHFVR